MTARWWQVGAVALAAAVLLGPGRAFAGFNEWTTAGPPDTSILALAVNPLSPRIVYGGTSGTGVFVTLDGGASWSATNAGLTNLLVPALAIHPFDPSIVYAGTTGGGMFQSVDAGRTWAPINDGLANPLISAIAIDPATPTILYVGTTGGGVFKSANGGTSWGPVNNGLVNSLITALAVDPLAPTVVYAGTSGGGVFRTVDGGNRWVEVNTGLANRVVTSLAINPQVPSILYAGTTGGGVFRSTTGGAFWTALNTNLTNTVVTEVVVNPLVPTTVYASTSGGGVFRSVNAGASWVAFNNGLANSIVNTLAITPAGACVHAGTPGSGVFDFALEPTGCAPIEVAASVLPSSRSVVVGSPATAFATIINPARVTAVSCGIAPLSAVPATFAFQTTDPTTNALTGSPNTAVDIPPGALQTYVISLTPTAAFPSIDVPFDFGCTNTASAAIITGVNTLLLSASGTPVPDIIALAAADSGIVSIPGVTGTGTFAVATLNLGAGSLITAVADTGDAPVFVSLAICETEPATGACRAAPGAAVTKTIDAGETPTYAVFVTGRAPVLFIPSVNRVYVRFKDPGGVTRGSTSVAVRTQ